MSWLALALYVIGAILMYTMMIDDDYPEPLGINLTIAILWPLFVPLFIIWSFLERKTD